ncbi:hypothetical protein OH491_01215 [Termitidicoccus mucosus]
MNKNRILILILISFISLYCIGCRDTNSSENHMPEPLSIMSENGINPHAIPLYAKEFIGKLNVDMPKNSNWRNFHIDIESAITWKGIKNVVLQARVAKDEFTGGNYFSIIEDKQRIRIEKRYVLDNSVTILSLYLEKNHEGEFVYCAFTKGYL